jgi:hypothetical protein
MERTPMDAPVASSNLGAWALTIAVGVIIAILGAILYDMNERIKYVERALPTKEEIREAMREVLNERKR